MAIYNVDIIESTGEDIIHPNLELVIAREATESAYANDISNVSVIKSASVTESENANTNNLFILSFTKSLIEAANANSTEDSTVINIIGRILEFTGMHDICSAVSGVQLIASVPGAAHVITITPSGAVTLRRDNYD